MVTKWDGFRMLRVAWACSERGHPMPQHPNAGPTLLGAEERVREARRLMLFAPLTLAAVTGVRRRCARPYSPWRNGKVERMNRTLA